jgi:hypothetical protein
VIGAQLLRASMARTCGMVGSVNAGRNTKEEQRERRGSPSPATSFPGGGELGAAALCEGSASSTRVDVLRVQRGEWELERSLKRNEGREGGETEGCGGRRPCHRWTAAITGSGAG